MAHFQGFLVLGLYSQLLHPKSTYLAAPSCDRDTNRWDALGRGCLWSPRWSWLCCYQRCDCSWERMSRNTSLAWLLGLPEGILEICSLPAHVSVQWLSNAKSIDAGLCNGNIALNCRGSSLSFSLDIIDKNRRIFYLSKGQKCWSNNTFKMVCMNTQEIEEEKQKRWSEQIRASKFRRSVSKDGIKKKCWLYGLWYFDGDDGKISCTVWYC